MKTNRLTTRLLPLLAAFALLGSAHAQTAVPDYLSYQGRALNADGTTIGSGTPVNRTVTFRVWDHPSNGLAANLIYSEQQVVTISNGEFSALIGAGAATTGTPLGYSESTKGVPTVKISSAYSSATRYLGVTIDDGTVAADNEISPRQQFVTSSYAFRAKVAESVDANAISSAMLATGAVGANQLAAAAVTNAKLGTDAVMTTNILNLNVTTAKIADLNVTTGKIADANVTTAKIADANVTTAKIADLNVSTAKLADASVTTAKLADASVTGAKIASATIAAGNLAAGAVTSTGILDGTIATADMADSAVTGAKVATDTLVAGNIAAGAVGTSEIADGSITASDLGAAGITSDETSQLRIVRGSVAANGTTINNGLGFTPTKISPTSPTPAGAYRVRFATPFSGTPAVTVSGFNPGVYDVRATVYNASSLGFDIGVVVNGAWSDISGYSFIAIGPR